MTVRFTKHALEMLLFRRIKKNYVEKLVNSPDEKTIGKRGKVVYYKSFGKNYLKAVVAEEMGEKIVITQYWIAKRRVRK